MSDLEIALAVKPPIADNTYPVWIGNVGHCLFFITFISNL